MVSPDQSPSREVNILSAVVLDNKLKSMQDNHESKGHHTEVKANPHNGPRVENELRARPRRIGTYKQERIRDPGPWSLL